MNGAEFNSPLHKMASTTKSDLWNDSCSIKELQYAIENGAVGATANPVIVGEVLNKEMHIWEKRIFELITEIPSATEDEITWKLIEEMSVAGAKHLEPVFQAQNGKQGRLSIQTDPKYYRNAELMINQALRFNSLAPNIIVKIPVTRAGIEAIEEATYHGISINATVCFTVPQALAVGAAVEKGLKRRESENKDVSKMGPVCTIMVGRIDDWLKVVADKEDIICDPACLEWAGVAVMKKAYKIYQQRGYRARLLSAATRNHMHWSEFIGGDLVVTLTHQWQKRFNESDIDVVQRIDMDVDKKIVAELTAKFQDFRRAYAEEGMSIDEFDEYGATRRTLRQFLTGYDDLLSVVRNYLLPDPDAE